MPFPTRTTKGAHSCNGHQDVTNSVEPYILCPWALIWSTFGTYVDQLGAHGHKM